MEAPAVTMDGIAIKAQVLALWPSVRTIAPGMYFAADTWGPGLAASILRVAGRAFG